MPFRNSMLARLEGTARPGARPEGSDRADALRADALRVVQIGFFNDPQGRAPEELLAAWPTLCDVAESASRAGLHISVVQTSRHLRRIDRDGVAYHFLPIGGRSAPIVPGSGLATLIREISPDIFHVHGLGFPREVLALAALAPGIPILLQDHADAVPRPWNRPLWRRSASVVTGFAFCSRAQAAPFRRAGLLGAGAAIHAVPEATSRFSPGSPAQARRAMRVTGDPIILWVGHLNDNKDPLAVLDGVSRAARVLPRLSLYCCFGTAPLLSAVRRRIASEQHLTRCVHLLGTVPHAHIETLMRAADIFVLGSRREGSGYALIEALACGLPPVVTDIPSFRALTGAGAVGRLWPCGDANALSEAIIATAAQIAHRGSELRTAVRRHFDRELSLDALGSKLARAYEGAIHCAESGAASFGRDMRPHPAAPGAGSAVDD